MNLPTILDWLNRLDGWRGFPTLYLLMLTAVIITVAFEWRVSIFALMVHYFLLGLLLVDLLEPRLAMVKLLTGLFVCLMLYFTGRQVNWGRAVSPKLMQLSLGKRTVPLTAPVRAGVILLIGAVVLGMSQLSFFQLPLLEGRGAYLNTAVYLLTLLGILGILLSAADPFQAGLGLLLFVAGFELYYSSIAQTTTMLIVFVSVNFIITLIVSTLTQLHFIKPPLPSK